MLEGNVVGLSGDELMVRVGPDGSEDVLAGPQARFFDMTRPMKRWTLIAPEALDGAPDLVAWAQRGVSFARSLPARG